MGNLGLSELIIILIILAVPVAIVIMALRASRNKRP
jgi:hypothetical protein